MGRGNRVTIIEGLESRLLLSTSRLALISDFGTLQGSEADVANLVKQWNTASPLDAIITSGDNDQNNGDDYVDRVGNYYDEFIYGRGSATERFLPAPGNHDWGYNSGRGTLTYYEDFFAVPNATQGNTSGNERYYNYKVGAVEVFVIDSDTHEPDGTSSTSVQAQWLQNALASSTAPWQIVSFHHAPYSSASGHGNTAYMQWEFQEWGADLVVSGHDHIYERINVNGLRYLVNGTGGWDSLSGLTTPVAGSEVRYNAENGAILLEANDTTLAYSFINTAGQTIDTYSMTSVPLPNIAVTAANASEAGQVGGFTFTRSNILMGDVTVNFTISGTATSGTDYQSVGASVLIPDGVTSVTIPVTAINDTLAEGDETVILTITDNPAYIRRNTTATATIADDDLATLSFQQGLGGYSGTSDTQLRQANPTTDSSAAASINIDGDEPAGSGSDVQGLLRFDDIFGPAPAQIPVGSQIISATLELQVFNSGDAIKVHRMLVNWLDTATWSSMGAGIQADGIEAAATADITTGAIAVGKLSLNVTNALAAWAADLAANQGWALLPTGSDGVDLYSSESSNTRPKLIVRFVANHAPVAADDAFNGTEDSVLAVAAPGLLANDNDIDGNPLSALLINGPSNGSLILNPDGSFTYTPGVNFNGTDSFTYAASDGAASSVPAVVTIAVDPANDAPIANDDGYTIAENTTLIVAALGVLANDSDPDGDALSATLVLAPSHGTLALDPNGSFVYTPDAEYVGPDSFTYTAGDGLLASNAALVSITVTRTNVAPAAVNDAYAVSEDAVLDVSSLGVLNNDSDADGDALAAVLVGGPANGSVVLMADGLFTYTPAVNFNGADSFTYRAVDAIGALSSVATVTLTVNPVNDAPSAVNDVFAGDEDSVLNGNVLANDLDIDGDALTASLLSGPIDGSLILNPDGSFIYTPSANWNGSVSFSYRVSDGAGGLGTAGVSLTVTPVNDVPLANNDAAAADEDTLLSGNVLANDTDVDGNPLTASLLIGPANGPLVLNPDGSFTYTPNADWSGSDSFTYQVSDGAGGLCTAVVLLTVNPVNDAPLAGNDAASVVEGGTLNGGSVLANDSDVEGDRLTAALVGAPANGTLTLNSDGTYTYRPNAGFSGSDSFTYQAGDGLALSNTAIVNITVTPAMRIDRAIGQTAVYGAVTGSYTATHASDGTYQSIRESLYSNNRKTRLEHRWQFNVAGGSAVTFFVEAHKTAGVDNFAFEYSTDGGTIWLPMLTVTKTAPDDQYQSFDMPSGLGGTVQVRVIDTNSSTPEKVQETVFIDDMFIRSNLVPLPTVTVTASDASASEAGDPGEFVVSRNDASGDLTVFLNIAGTATNGVDYVAIPAQVTILAGQNSAVFSVNPIQDAESEGDEGVVVSLASSVSYRIGDQSTAVVNIADDDPAPAVPAAPSNLAGAALGTTQIQLSWTDNSLIEDGFQIEYSSSASFTNATTVRVPAGSTSHTVGGLTANTVYYFRVCAYNAAGVSTYSNVIQVRTKRK